MFKRFIGPFLLLFALTAAPLSGSAQEGGISRKKQEKLLEKKAKEDKKAKAKKEKFDRKRHLSLQDKATRKRLKRHNKRADRNGSNTHKDGFFHRTFGW
jgi:Ni/Co efflux regulator RcnB